MKNKLCSMVVLFASASLYSAQPHLSDISSDRTWLSDFTFPAFFVKREVARTSTRLHIPPVGLTIGNDAWPLSVSQDHDFLIKHEIWTPSNFTIGCTFIAVALWYVVKTYQSCKRHKQEEIQRKERADKKKEWREISVKQIDCLKRLCDKYQAYEEYDVKANKSNPKGVL